MIIIVLASVLVLSMIAWSARKVLGWGPCSICAGVSLTWMWMLAGMWFGVLPVERYELMTAVLMGASIGGIVTELKKLFPKLHASTNGAAVEKLEKELKDNCC